MTKKILIVDDDKDITMVFAMKLKQLGYETIASLSGEEAMEKLSENPDLFLLDIQLSGMSGIELAEKIKSDTSHKDKPMIFISGKVDQEKGGIPDLPNSDFLVKPCSFEKLHEKIKNMIG